MYVSYTEGSSSPTPTSYTPDGSTAPTRLHTRKLDFHALVTWQVAHDFALLTWNVQAMPLGYYYTQNAHPQLILRFYHTAS